MEIGSIFKNLKIDTYYKFLLVLFGIVFIISLFIDIKGLSQKYIQNLSIWIIGTSIVVWVWESFMRVLSFYIYEVDIRKLKFPITNKDRTRYPRQVLIASIINILVQLIIWVYVIFIKVPEL